MNATVRQIVTSETGDATVAQLAEAAEAVLTTGLHWLSCKDGGSEWEDDDPEQAEAALAAALDHYWELRMP